MLLALALGLGHDILHRVRPITQVRQLFTLTPHHSTPITYAEASSGRQPYTQESATMNPIQNIPPHQRQEFMRTLEELQVKDSLM